MTGLRVMPAPWGPAHGGTLAGNGHPSARPNLSWRARKSPIRGGSPERFLHLTAVRAVAHTVVPRLCIVCTVRLEEDLPITLGVSRLTALSPSVRQGTLT